MQVIKRIDESLIKVEKLKKDNEQKSNEIKEKLIERKTLRTKLNTSMDNLEKEVDISRSIAEATRKESAKMSEDFESFKTDELRKQKDDLLKLEENHKKELEALESRLQQTLQELIEKEKKSHSEEISSLSRRINLNRLELLQQFHTQGKHQVETALTNIRRPSSRTQDYRKRFSLPVPLNLSSGEDEMTNSLPPTPSKQRHISESLNETDLRYSQIGASTPEKEGYFEFGPRRPPSAQSGRLQERVPTPPPNIHRRPSYP